MAIGQRYFRIKHLKYLIDTCQRHREKLIDELIDNATNDTLVMRRFRMIHELSSFESSMTKKIYNFQTNDVEDFNLAWIDQQISFITNRNA